ncbi:MAG: M14 family zinc carboxypeptidase [Capnocytophaga sp.]|uniref:M14 family zinc carboxypeptidase n=1 Tax=Capnocytophaga sp. TaxID=44737 RepID=UPI003F9FE86C
MKNTLSGRYISFSMITPVLEKYTFQQIIFLGNSVRGIPINLYQVGNGRKKILIWSQMHGNESTTTKALFKVLKQLKTADFLSELSIYIIPMLNPDGAELYTRVNYNKVDLNRDAYLLTQPESKCLRKAYDLVKPDYCFNLHDQRTIFSVAQTSQPATISFLAPAYNQERSINDVRQQAMRLIVLMNKTLQEIIPNQIARFDDSFNINCTGDRYTQLGTPTILFEAGHSPNDYNREQTTKYIATALFTALQAIALGKVTKVNFQEYFNIPENDKCFYDIILRDDTHSGNDVGIQYQEVLEGGRIVFTPCIAEIADLSHKYGHQEKPLSDFLKPPFNKKYIENELDLNKLYLEKIE